MKKHPQPLSCLDLNRTPLPPPATPVAAASLSSGPAFIRHRNNTMKTQAEQIGGRFRAWTVRALLISMRGFVDGGRLDCRTDKRLMSAPGGRRGASVGSVTARLTEAPKLDEQGLTVRLIVAGKVAGPNVARHLWLARWSAGQGRGVLWETAAFVVIWLSGLIGVALCLL